MKKVLISFVGTNDAGKLISKTDGAILTAIKNEKYDEVILLWNETNLGNANYSDVVKYLVDEISSKKIVVKKHEFSLQDVTDHNLIYSQLKSFTDTLQKTRTIHYTAAISSGTPAMQVCWILLAESGDFSEVYPLRLIKVKDPKFGDSKNIVVKLDTTLPKIIRLKNELEIVKNDLIPVAIINISRGIITVGGTEIILSPIEFCYYRYFCERVRVGLGDEKYSGFTVHLKFMEKILSYHEKSFPDLELNRVDLLKMIKNRTELGIQTFRGNISKINKKIKASLVNDTLINQFQISITGKRGAKYYGINADPPKIKILN